MDGGMMAGDILHTKDKSVHIDRQNKTYFVLPSGDGQQGGASQPQPTVTKTSETMKIIGYNCTKYIVTIESNTDKPLQSNMWTTTDIKDIDLKAMAKKQTMTGRGQIDVLPVKG